MSSVSFPSSGGMSISPQVRTERTGGSEVGKEETTSSSKISCLAKACIALLVLGLCVGIGIILGPLMGIGLVVSLAFSAILVGVVLVPLCLCVLCCKLLTRGQKEVQNQLIQGQKILQTQDKLLTHSSLDLGKKIG